MSAWKGKITRASYSDKIFKTEFQRSVINMGMKFWNHLPNSSLTQSLKVYGIYRLEILE